MYDENNNKKINIYNHETGKTDVVVYEETLGEGYLNGELIMSTIEESSLEKNVSEIETKAKYTYVGSKSKKVSWVETTTVANVVALIAAAIGNMTGAKVLSSLGSSYVKSMISNYKSATVNVKIYEWVTGKITNYKYVWSITPKGGSKKGPYTDYMAV